MVLNVMYMYMYVYMHVDVYRYIIIIHTHNIMLYTYIHVHVYSMLSHFEESAVYATNAHFFTLCLLQLLEKKKGQSIDDLCQNLECLCHCLTTVGQKLDTEKAKVRCPMNISSTGIHTCTCIYMCIYMYFNIYMYACEHQSWTQFSLSGRMVVVCM